MSSASPHGSDAEALLAAIVASTDDAIISVCHQGLVTSWNQGAAALFGFSAEEMLGHAVALLLPPERVPEEAALLERVSGGETIKSFEAVRRHKNGGLHEVSVTLSPIRDQTGRVIGASQIVRDISERKQSDARARELTERLNRIYRLVPGVVYQFMRRPDGSYCIPFASEAMRLIFRVAPNEVEQDATPIFQNVEPDDITGLTESIERSASTLKPWNHEFRYRHTDGSVAWLRGDAMPEPLADGSVLWHGFITDVTERHRIETKLVESAKLESLGVLAGGIAHDFNNLLTGILGNASLARFDLPATSPGQPLLDQIEQAARRAADLCKQMLAYSGKGRFVIQPLDLNKLIRDTTHLLQISIAGNCVLHFDLGRHLPAVNADASQLRQVLMNVIVNASESIGDRNGVVTVTTGVERVDETYLRGFRPDASPAPGDYVYIEVRDNGCGMNAITMRKMFDPFFTTKFTGRGLGLAAVLGIVRGHKGGVKVFSELGKGTTFRLFFPTVTAQAQDSSLPFFLDTSGYQGTGTALIVDDEETVRMVASRMLERIGFQVVLAADGAEGVEKFRAEPNRYAFVLLDLTMPNMNGEEAFRQMQAIQPDVRVILTSGFNQQEAVDRFAGKGLAGFIQKPFELNRLTQTIRLAIGR